jgi:hypothetical protein
MRGSQLRIDSKTFGALTANPSPFLLVIVVPRLATSGEKACFPGNC